MDFLLEPLELGSEFSDLFTSPSLKITCDGGHSCTKGTVENTVPAQ